MKIKFAALFLWLFVSHLFAAVTVMVQENGTLRAPTNFFGANLTNEDATITLELLDGGRMRISGMAAGSATNAPPMSAPFLFHSTTNGVDYTSGALYLYFTGPFLWAETNGGQLRVLTTNLLSGAVITNYVTNLIATSSNSVRLVAGLDSTNAILSMTVQSIGSNGVIYPATNINFVGATKMTNDSGKISVEITGGTGTPAGADMDVQFNNAGALGADSGDFFYSTTSNRLYVPYFQAFNHAYFNGNAYVDYVMYAAAFDGDGSALTNLSTNFSGIIATNVTAYAMTAYNFDVLTNLRVGTAVVTNAQTNLGAIWISGTNLHALAATGGTGSTNMSDAGFTVLLNGNLQASNSVSASNAYFGALTIAGTGTNSYFDAVHGTNFYQRGTNLWEKMMTLGGGGNLQTNANQFGANTVLTIKDGPEITNINHTGTLLTDDIGLYGGLISMLSANPFRITNESSAGSVVIGSAVRVFGELQVTNAGTNSTFDAVHGTNFYQRGTNLWEKMMTLGGGGNLQTNANQFGPQVLLTIKSGAILTNLNHVGTLNSDDLTLNGGMIGIVGTIPLRLTNSDQNASIVLNSGADVFGQLNANGAGVTNLPVAGNHTLLTPGTNYAALVANAVSNLVFTIGSEGTNNVIAHTNLSAAAVGGLTVTNQVLYLTATTNIWSATTGTNLHVNFNVPSVTIWATNGFSLTNFVGLEAGEGTSTKYLDMEIIGCTNTANVLVFPTLGGKQFGVRMLTNAASPIHVSIANGIRYQFSWRAKGTNLSLVSAAFQ